MSDELYFSPVEEAIRKAMREGLFDNLPGLGKPLQLGDDPNTPEDSRLAYKIMRDHQVAPDWVMMRETLDAQQQHILQEMQRSYKIYRNSLQDAERLGDLEKISRVRRTWERLTGIFEEAAEQYNQQVLVYNLKLPLSVAQRHAMSISRELEKIARALG